MSVAGQPTLSAHFGQPFGVRRIAGFKHKNAINPGGVLINGGRDDPEGP